MSPRKALARWPLRIFRYERQIYAMPIRRYLVGHPVGLIKTDMHPDLVPPQGLEP